MHRLRSSLVVAMLALALPVPVLAIPQPGRPAPAFSLPSLAGPRVGTASLHGKPVYLNFFASWCGPCNSEAPSVAALFAKYRARGLQIVGIDEQEDAAKARGFARQYHWRFPIALDDGGTASAYGAIALPVHVFIDRQGRVSTFRLGEMQPAEIEAAIRKIV